MGQRLDQVLVARGLVPTRARARDVILRGEVTVAGAPARKASQSVSTEDVVEVSGEARRYVSRGALKLVAGLEAFGFGVVGRCAIDVGASTGGFTQVLLENGVARVYAVDVGHDQLRDKISKHGRVVCLEGMDARELTRENVPDPIDAIVCDVSFISLTKVLPAVFELAAPGAWFIGLIKPQFEAGPDAIGKGGIVRDDDTRARVVSDIEAWLSSLAGWTIAGIVPSPITGGSGNAEYLIGAQYQLEQVT